MSYERCDYESVDEKSLSLSYVTRNYERKTLGSNGLIYEMLTCSEEVSNIYKIIFHLYLNAVRLLHNSKN